MSKEYAKISDTEIEIKETKIVSDKETMIKIVKKTLTELNERKNALQILLDKRIAAYAKQKEEEMARQDAQMAEDEELNEWKKEFAEITEEIGTAETMGITPILSEKMILP